MLCSGTKPDVKIHGNDLHLPDSPSGKAGSNLLSFPAAPWREFLQALISDVSDGTERELEVKEQEQVRAGKSPFPLLSVFKDGAVFLWFLHFPDLSPFCTS